MAKKQAQKSVPTMVTGKQIQGIPLNDLHLDPNNPRFGAKAGNFKSEQNILDFIVEQFGIQDVISSIAVNGYFSSEPILAKREKDGGPLVVAEGNRRLAACLILAKDPRAKNQQRRSEEFRELHKKHGSKPFDPVPTVVFDTRTDINELVPYLGVRHIAGAQGWDSYAKAAWVAKAVDEQGLELNDVIHMIGDDSNLAQRMLLGYYVVKQVIDAGLFDPERTSKKGSKSNPDFPFSWVYTALGYRNIRDWLGVDADPRKAPVRKENLNNAGQLFSWMFGQGDDRAAIAESREIGSLATAIADNEQQSLLRDGLSIKEVRRKTRPPAEQISDALTKSRSLLTDVIGLLSDGSVTANEAEKSLDLSKRVRTLSIRVFRELEKAAGFAEADDE